MNRIGPFTGLLLCAFLATTGAQAGPIVSVRCTKMSDGRLLVSADQSFLDRATTLGYNHKVCSVHYEVRKFTRTVKDTYGNTEGICLVELRKWKYLPSGVCK